MMTSDTTNPEGVRRGPHQRQVALWTDDPFPRLVARRAGVPLSHTG
jgi:hypothetical protein